MDPGPSQGVYTPLSTLPARNDGDFGRGVWFGCAATAADQEDEVMSDKETDSLLEELEETVQSTYHSVVEDAVAALKKHTRERART